MRRMGLIFLILLFLVGICAGGEDGIHKITILGNVRIDEGVIRRAIKARVGEPFSSEQAREDLRSIFALGFFTDVQVDIKSTPKGKEVIFIVVERPSVKEVLIIGNDKLKLEDIKEKVTLPPRSILNQEKVMESSEQIRRLYFSKGYYGVNVAHKIDFLETNEAVVTFRIAEGPKGRIRKIIFKGNQKIKSSELKKVMMTKQWNVFFILTKTGILDEDILQNDIHLLTAHYFDHGYLDVKISEPKIDFTDAKRIRIEIDIEEGPLYRLGTIDFRGDLLTTEENLFSALTLRRGDVFSNSAIRRQVSALTEMFANQGYAYVEIIPETSIDSENLLVHLTFEIDKKKQVSFERMRIVGNAKTRDKVVRRELQVAEGDLYSAAKISKSRDRLKRTGFFKEVDFTTSRGSTDEKINLDIKVEEAPTGALSFGVGYSSIEKVFGSVSISDRNFFGYGYHGALRFKLGADSRDLRFSFTDPYFLGTHYAAGIDLYHESREFFTSYSYKTMGGNLRVGRELTESIRVDSMYKLENVNVFDVRDNASLFIQEQKGRRTTSALSLTFSMDTRDDFFAPSRGARHSLSVENAGGILGGDNYFVRSQGETSWFFPLPLKTVLNLRGKIGVVEPYGGRDIPVYEKFFIGGLYTLRGFEYGQAGPIDENREPLGASKMAIFNAELIFPVAREIGLRGAIFFDVGKGFDKWRDVAPLKTAAGAGIRWFSPLGPIHLDLGFNLNPKKGEKRRVFDFTVGTVF